MPSTTIYKRGEVILAEIDFTIAGEGSKNRPAVVLSTPSFNGSGTKLVVAAITGSLPVIPRPGNVILIDWIAAGLTKRSAFRGVLLTIDTSDVIRPLGTLSDTDMTAVSAGVAEILGYTI